MAIWPSNSSHALKHEILNFEHDIPFNNVKALDVPNQIGKKNTISLARIRENSTSKTIK